MSFKPEPMQNTSTPMQKEEKGELPISKCCKARVDTEDESAFCSECKNYLQDDEIIYPTPKEPEWKELGGKIHGILNNTISRKLTLKEYEKVVELIAQVFDKGQILLQSRDREIEQVVENIEQAKRICQKANGTYKYDVIYDECLAEIKQLIIK